MSRTISSAAYADTKPHYDILDGLRGVAALMVICYHMFEGFATTPIDQRFNHGYLSVDFFFILSGFVIGYAYDDRWPRLTKKGFFKRRLIRLHPMVVLGAVLGALTFLIQGSVQWDGTHIGIQWVLLALFLTLFMLPVYPGAGAEVRGNGELFPLNGPQWSLFFEYIGNILYAFFIHKFSTRTLACLTALWGVLLAVFSIGNFSGYGHMGVGWTMAEWNLPGGLLRMLFSYSAGMLMARVFRPVRVRGAFWICAAVIILVVSLPNVGGEAHKWMNGIYDAVAILFVFPTLVWLGASEVVTKGSTKRVCKFLGDLSFPVYMVHYPFMYLLYAWVWKHGYQFEEIWPVAVGTAVGCIVLGYASLKLYDEPVRRWLTKRYLRK